MTGARHSMYGPVGSGKVPYRQVEWLQSTGSQYIDTGMPPPAQYTGYQVEIEYRYTSKPRNDTWLFGYWNVVPSARLYLIGYYNGYRCGAGPDNSTYWCNTPYDSNFHVAKLLNDGAYFDGVRKAPTNLSGIAAHADRGLWLFKSEHIDTGGVRQVKYCKMWTIDGELVRHFVPVLDNNDIPCMYDLVSKTLFYNAGTGSFTAGPYVTSPKDGLPQGVYKVDYVESNGSQYVDTGIVLDPRTYEYEARFQFKSDTGSGTTFSVVYAGWSSSYKVSIVGCGLYNTGRIVTSLDAGYSPSSGEYVGWAKGTVIEMSLHGSDLMYNGQHFTMSRPQANSGMPDTTQPVFGTKVGPASSNYMTELPKARCWKYKLWTSPGVLALDLVPVCINANSTAVGAFYDRVSKTLIRASSGNLTWGVGRV